MTLRLLLSLVLVISGQCLTANLHLQTTATTTYQTGLDNRELSLINIMSLAELDLNIASSTIQTQGTINQTQINNAVLIVDQQRIAVNNLTSYINANANPVPPPCNGSASVDQLRTTLQNEAILLKNAVLRFRAALVNCANCIITSQLNTLILQQQNVVQVVNQIVLSNCTSAPPLLQPQTPSGLVNLAFSQYKDNLQAKNWVFGNITATQYKYEIFALSTQYNLTSCPINKPYVNPLTLVCFDCPLGMNFSLGQKTCQPCPLNFTFDLVNLQCQSPCNSSTFYNATSQQCQPLPPQNTSSLCPLTAPIWNATTLSCQQCPASQPVFNISTSNCSACPANSSWDPLLNQCVPFCPTNYYFSPTALTCVPITQCPANSVYSNATGSCQIFCPNGTILNNFTQQCQKPLQHNCTNIKPIWNNITLTCELCPQSTPLWNQTTQTCEVCPPNSPVFNYTNFQCGPLICASGYQWNRVLLKCSPLNGSCPLPNQGYVFILQSCIAMCQPNHTYFANNNTCQCFASAPFYNSTSKLCQIPPCPNNTLWNSYLLRCVATNQTCLAWQQYNFTNGTCSNVCPVNITFLSNNNSCNCTPQLPVFNSVNRTCQAPTCPNGTQWNSYLLNCTSLQGNCSTNQLYNFTLGQCLTMCQANISYVASNNSCNCTPQMPVFNYTDRFCQPPVCPIGYLWNKYLFRCVKVNVTCQTWQQYNFTNATCENVCLVNQTYFPKYNNCSCPASIPFYNQTVANCTIPPCPNNTLWNTYLLRCVATNQSCLSWQVYNFTNGTCSNVCLFNQTYFSNNHTCTCPPQLPFYNTTLGNCTIPPCANGTAWNPLLLNCTPLNGTCPSWQLWSFLPSKCVSVCPVNQTYYPATGLCSCPAAFPIFDNTTRICLQPVCPAGQQWDRVLLICAPTTKNCSVWQYFNFTSQLCVDMCPIGVPYYSRTDTCFCPVFAPYFNTTTRLCQPPTCPPGYFYNPYLIKCSSLTGNCSINQFYSLTTEQCITMCPVNHTYFASNNSCSCPPSYPLYNSTTQNCTGLPCPSGAGWNPLFQSCTPLLLPCQNWQQFNFTLQACENMCPANHTYYPSNNSCECFANAPIFDPINRTCVVPNCPNGTKYDPYLQGCVPLHGNCFIWQLYNFTTASCVDMCPVGQAYLATSNSCQCPPEFPVWQPVNRTCLVPQCPQGYLYNMFLMKCSPLNGNCAINQFYDFTTQNCITRCQTGHLYYQQNDTCQCFPAAPFFNATSRLCQVPVCPALTSWNSQLLLCISVLGQCQPWQLYNSTSTTCTNMCGINQTYYINNDSCSCFPARPIFVLATRQCEVPQCLYGQIWSTFFYQCQCPSGYQFNSTALQCQPYCLPGYYFDPTTSFCQPLCPIHMFLNPSNQCQCLPGYAINANGIGCRPRCPAGFAYSNVTLQCQPICQSNMVVNSNNQCQCLPGYVINPYGLGCVPQCPAGTTYSFSSLQCAPICGPNMFVNSINQCQCNLGYAISPNGGCLPNCPTGYQYNAATSLCAPLCSANMVINANNQCVCTPGYIVDPNTGVCVPSCPAGQFYNSSIFSCQTQCNPNMYLNSNNQCVCISGYVLDPNGLTCRAQCPPGLTFNPTTLACQPLCGTNMFINSSNICQCYPGFVPSKTSFGCVHYCPPGYFYNTTILSCQLKCGVNMHINATGSCVCDYGFMPSTLQQDCVPILCVIGHVYNYTTQRCEPQCGPNMFVNATNQCQCNPGYVPNANGFGCRQQCPPSFVYNLTILACQPICIQNQFLNATNQCQCINGYVMINGVCYPQCQPGTYFNQAISACSPICSLNQFLNSTNQCQCNQGYILNPTTGICQIVVPICPAGSFLDVSTNQCVQCPSGYAYDPATNLCKKIICPANYTYNVTSGLCDLVTIKCQIGYYYDVNAGKCMQQYITNPATPNLIVQNMANYTNYYNTQKQINPNIVDCPPASPFYVPSLGQCAHCPAAFPYYNLDTYQCQNCGNTVYSPSTYNCALPPQVQVNPTLSRFVSNIF